MTEPEPVYIFVKGAGWVPKMHVVAPRKRIDAMDNYPLDWNTVCLTCGNIFRTTLWLL